MRKIVIVVFICMGMFISNAQNKVTLFADSTEIKISKHIYGHFAEHLGRVIYDGICR